MTVSRYSAELLAANVAARMADRDTNAAAIDWTARLEPGTTQRLLAADPEAWPCPTAMTRLAYALGTSTRYLLADDGG